MARPLRRAVGGQLSASPRLWTLVSREDCQLEEMMGSSYIICVFYL